MFFGPPGSGSVVRDTDPDPSIIMQKYFYKTLIPDPNPDLDPLVRGPDPTLDPSLLS